MRRITLLLLIVAIANIVVSSPLRASSPVINHSTTSISASFYRYFANFLRVMNERYVQVDLVNDGSDDEMVRGDADDYADGKDDPNDRDDDDIDILPPGISEKNIAH